MKQYIEMECTIIFFNEIDIICTSFPDPGDEVMPDPFID